MASFSLDKEKGRARLFFRYAGRQFNKTIRVDSYKRDDRERAAERLCALAEETVLDLERGKLVLPEGADPAAFIVSGGKVVRKEAEQAPPPEALDLKALFDLYRAEPPAHLEQSTRKMQEIHFRRVLEVFPKADVKSFDRATAQTYVSRRAKQTFRGRPIQRETIAKELKTLRGAWAWVASRRPELVPPPFALKDLSLPKATERLPFTSWQEVEKEVARGGLSAREVEALWDCLYLSRDEVRGLLEYVEGADGCPFVVPMFYMGAFTGMRRSELCRSRVADWRFSDKTVKVRQKKRDKEKSFTYRDLPIHPDLARVMKAWFDAHPGGQYALCRQDRTSLTWDEASHHFRKTLCGSKWAVVRGFHVLRHSFASSLAAAGVDQRKIDRWMGHSTEIRWRYQHLRPEDQQEAIGVL